MHLHPLATHWLSNILCRFLAVFRLALLLCLFSSPLALAQPVITYFHNDASGTPLLATDAAGNVVWKENHKPYGERVLKQAANNNSTNKLGFAGKPYDNQTGLSYMGARYYDPVIGRFMGVDPVDFQENNVHSFNRYAYANNNPYKFVDPDGRIPVPVIIYGVVRASMWVAQRQAGLAAAATVGAEIATGASMGPVSAVEGMAARGIGSAVTKYEVGTFNTLKGKSVAGDGLDIHHAVQKNPAGQTISGYDPATAPSIAIPRGEHSRIPTLKGEYSGSARSLLAKDIRDLRGNTNASNGSLKDLIDLNKQTYPDAFNK